MKTKLNYQATLNIFKSYMIKYHLFFEIIRRLMNIQVFCRSYGILFLALFLCCISYGCGNRVDSSQSSENIEDRWERRIGKYTNNVIKLRVNKALNHIAGNSRFKYQIAAGVTIKRPKENGLPDEIELPALKRVEEILVEKLVNSGLAVHAIDIRINKRCDYIFYGENKKKIEKAINMSGEKIGEYLVEFTIKKDTKWATYTWFSKFGIDY